MVFVVLAVLAALGATAINRTRELARKTACQDNLRELGLSLSGFVDRMGTFPPGTVMNKDVPAEKRLSWYVETWCFFAPQESLVVQKDQPWDSPANLKPKRRFADGADLREIEGDLRQLALARCPAASFRSPPEVPDVTTYIGIAGVGADSPRLPRNDPKAGIWGYDRRTLPGDIKRGLASTLLLAETAFQNGFWTAGGPPTVRGVIMDGQPLIAISGQFGGIHANGCNVVFADASARFLSESHEPQVLASMTTLADDSETDKGRTASKE